LLAQLPDNTRLCAVICLQTVHRQIPPQQKPRISPELWAAINAAYDNGRSLRELAAEYGVSRETVRQVIRRVRAPGKAYAVVGHFESGI
jgi:hypothetical protein